LPKVTAASLSETGWPLARPGTGWSSPWGPDPNGIHLFSLTDLMQKITLPEIAEADLRAAREFLFAARGEGRPTPPRRGPGVRHDVTFRHGIARSRIRSVSKHHD
jgi:hypothetical protein